MTRIERVAKALQADPPKVRGLTDRGKLRPLVAWTGSGSDRTFRFDLLENLLYSEAIKRHRDIILEGDPL